MASYGEKLNSLPQDLKKCFRDLENVRKKIINANWSIVFNKTCIKNNIWPNFTNIEGNVKRKLEIYVKRL